MLRRVEDVEVWFKPKRWSKNGQIEALIPGGGRHVLAFGTSATYDELKRQQESYPLRLATVRGRTYWQYQGRFYWDNDGLDDDEVYALLVTRHQRERGGIERAQAMVAMDLQSQDQSRRRDVIPDDVKQLVWLRDGGQCRRCGARAELQYDHLIPVALGGGSSPENLQILCGPCNRRKSAGLTIR